MHKAWNKDKAVNILTNVVSSKISKGNVPPVDKVVVGMTHGFHRSKFYGW